MDVAPAINEWRLQDRPEPDLGAVRIDVLCLVDHEDRERQKYHTFTVSPAEVFGVLDHWRHKYPPAQGWRNHQALPTRRDVPKGFDDRLYDNLSRAPWWLEKLGYKENTNFTFTYRASAALSNALTSLATSATWVAGYESATIDNSSNKDLDILVSLTTKVSSSAVTANTLIEIDSVSMQSDSAWPDVFDGTESAETVTSVGVKQGICLPLGFLNVDATTANRAYYLSKRSLAALYGGICPDKSLLFTAQNTGQNLSSTAGDHVTTTQGCYLTGT